MYDVMINIPNMAYQKQCNERFIRYENLEKLEAAFRAKTGAIIPSLHVGSVFYPLGGIFGRRSAVDPTKLMDLATIGEAENIDMFEPMSRQFLNYRTFKTAPFNQLRDQLVPLLKQNFALLSYVDYASMNQLRVPFAPPYVNCLKPVPVSLIKLHKITGCPILPMVGVPDGSFSESKLVFLDNSLIMETSKNYWDAPEEVFNKQMAYAINKTLNVYAVKYAHTWQQLLAFGEYIYKLRLSLPANCSRQDFLTQVRDKLRWVITSSFVPDRDDSKLLSILSDNMNQAIGALSNPNAAISTHKTYIRFFGASYVQELENLIKPARTLLKKIGEPNSAAILDQLLVDIHK
jgi:hypothetical protein